MLGVNIAAAGACEHAFRMGWQAAVDDCSYGEHDRPPWEPPPPSVPPPPPVYTVRTVEQDAFASFAENLGRMTYGDPNCVEGRIYAMAGLSAWIPSHNGVIEVSK